MINFAFVNSSVRRRITWAFGLFVALSMATVVITVGFRLYSTITDNLNHELEQRGHQDSKLLLQRIEYLLEGANVLVKNPLVINGLNDAQGRQTYLPELVKISAKAGMSVRWHCLASMGDRSIPACKLYQRMAIHPSCVVCWPMAWLVI
jgi:hypothetical protein